MKKFLGTIFILLISLGAIFGLFISSGSTLIVYISEGYDGEGFSLDYCGETIKLEENVFITDKICEGHLTASVGVLISQPVYITSGFNYLVEYRVENNVLISKSNIFK